MSFQAAEVLPNSRAARVGTELRPGDELVEVGKGKGLKLSMV